MNRPSNRRNDELRRITFERNFTRHAAGSVLVCFGDTRVLCTASIEDRVPPFLRGKNSGWVTAEYGMLPGSTNTRNMREASRGKQSGRTLEIQRLIGRSLRGVTNLKKLGERTITLDCDVLQADGGTRTASITGAWIALSDAMSHLLNNNIIKNDPMTGQIASVSVGIYKGTPVLDLDYSEDSNAETDMNVVMDADNRFIEVQGTAEGKPFSQDEMNDMLSLAGSGIRQLINLQREALVA